MLPKHAWVHVFGFLGLDEMGAFFAASKALWSSPDARGALLRAVARRSWLLGEVAGAPSNVHYPIEHKLHCVRVDDRRVCFVVAVEDLIDGELLCNANQEVMPLRLLTADRPWGQNECGADLALPCVHVPRRARDPTQPCDALRTERHTYRDAHVQLVYTWSQQNVERDEQVTDEDADNRGQIVSLRCRPSAFIRHLGARLVAAPRLQRRRVASSPPAISGKVD